MQKQCSYFQKGMCRNGNECKFIHTIDKMDQSSKQNQKQYMNHKQHTENDTKQSVSSNQKQCSFFQKGLCNKGDACLFQHTIIGSSTSKLEFKIPQFSYKYGFNVNNQPNELDDEEILIDGQPVLTFNPGYSACEVHDSGKIANLKKYKHIKYNTDTGTFNIYPTKKEGYTLYDLAFAIHACYLADGSSEDVFVYKINYDTLTKNLTESSNH